MLDTVQEAPSIKEHADVLTLDLAEVRSASLAPKPPASPATVKGDAAASLLKVIAAAARDPQVDIEKMERLMGMYERLQARAAEQAFNEAMTVAQAEMSPISADAENSSTKSKYATYAKLDRVLRPIYTKHGFAISFDNGDGAPDNHVRVLAYVSRGAFTRTYHADIPADGKGAKGGDVMTKTHAAGSANSYGMRYLLKMIFNVSVGEKDDDGNGAAGLGAGAMAEKIFDGLIDDLKKTTSDAAAAALWASGSKALAATECRGAYADFKKAVVSHRTALKGAAK